MRLALTRTGMQGSRVAIAAFPHTEVFVSFAVRRPVIKNSVNHRLTWHQKMRNGSDAELTRGIIWSCMNSSQRRRRGFSKSKRLLTIGLLTLLLG